jgi:hypothetical protein
MGRSICGQPLRQYRLVAIRVLGGGKEGYFGLYVCSCEFNCGGQAQEKERIRQKGRKGRRRNSKIEEAERAETKCPGRGNKGLRVFIS